jgi:V8-like Glu-specific endopeptidase
MKRLMTAVFVLFAAACGVDTDAPEASGPAVAARNDELVNAPEDTNHTFAVGLCMGELRADGSCDGALCSGTLVAPNLVLTARHCVHEIDWVDPSAFCGGSNTFLPQTLSPNTWVTAKRSVADPGGRWSKVKQIVVEPTTDICRDDIAYLVLEEPLRGVRPASVSSRLLTANPPQRVAVVGRGAVHMRYDMTDYSLADADWGGDRRRILENIPFRCVSNTDGACTEVDYFSANNTYALQKETFSFGTSVLSGDSGSGVYDQRAFSRRQFEVIGVAVTTTIGADGLTTASQAVRLDAHRVLTLRSYFAAARAACD